MTVYEGTKRLLPSLQNIGVRSGTVSYRLAATFPTSVPVGMVATFVVG